MDTQSRTSGHILIAYFIGSTFYRGRVVVPVLFRLFGSTVLWTLVAFAMVLIPVLMVLLVKLMERVRRHSLEKISELNHTQPLLLVNKILFTLFVFCNISCMLYANVSFFTTYYYPSIPFFIFMLVVMGLVLYALHFGFQSLPRVSIFVFFVTALVSLIYFINPSEIKWFAIPFELPQPIESDAWIVGGFLVMIYIFEPISFLLMADAATTKYSIKKVLLISLFFSLLSSYFAVRETWEFGLLTKDIRFPFFESWRNIILDPYIKQIDFFALIYWIASLFQRLLYSTTLLNKLWQAKNIYLGLIILAFGSVLAHFFLENSLLFISVHNGMYIMFMSFLIGSGILTLWIVLKGGKKIDAIKKT